MRNIFIFIIVLFIISGDLSGQDTIYVMKSGAVSFKKAIVDIDSISFRNSYKVSLSKKMSDDSRFSLFYSAYIATGYAEKMDNAIIDDESFNADSDKRPLMNFTVPEERPRELKSGFTVLATSNETLENYKDCPACPNGVKTLDDLEKIAEYYYSQLFSDGNGIKDRKDTRNYLNRYIAYHCLDRVLKLSRFIKDYDTPNQNKNIDMCEYISTLLDNSLLEIKLDRDFNHPLSNYGILNAVSNPDNAVMFTSYSVDGGLNGIYHEITKPLIYSKEFIADISSKRLRFDVASFFPELATNNMRGNNPEGLADIVGKTHAYLLPEGYLKNISASKETRISYVGASSAYEDYQGDYFYIKYPYNFTVKTPPIPAGKYELRMAYHPTYRRGTDQLYLDGLPCGEPINFTVMATDPEVGYVTPGSDKNDINGYKNDSLMRLNGYMKAPASYFSPGNWYGYYALDARHSNMTLRKILGTFTFDKTETHSLGIVSIESLSLWPHFILDFIEFIPVDKIKTEDIY